MTMDNDGNLYVALHNGNQEPPRGEIVVLNPAGEVLSRIAPAEGMRPGNLGFGRGKDANSFQWRLYRIQTVRRGHYFE
jgi:sugar lactone lactonase YvrE